MTSTFRASNAASFGLAFASIVACSVGADSTAPNQGDAPETAPEFVAALCDIYKPCCSAANLPSDGAQCRELLGRASEGQAYTRGAAQPCLDRARSEQRAGNLCVDDVVDVACPGVFAALDIGTKSPGETCEDHDECAKSSEGDVRCAPTDDGKSACQLQIRGTVGAGPCVGTKDGIVTTFHAPTDAPRGYVCHTEDALYCSNESGKCAKLAPSGADCASDETCQRDHYCDPSALKCTPRKAAGSACTRSNECKSDAYCEGTPGKCVARLPDGAPCSAAIACASRVCLLGKCVPVEEDSGASSGASPIRVARLCGGGP